MTIARYKFNDLANLVTSLDQQKMSGVVEVHSNEEGVLYFREGKLVHSLCDTLTGEEAAFEILSWNAGDLAYNSDEPMIKEESIDEHQAQIFLETVQLLQEKGKFKAPPPPRRVATAPLTAMSPRSSFFILPEGKLLHTNLNSAFLGFERLLATLMEQGLTGFLHVNLVDPIREGMVFFIEGRLADPRFASKGGVPIAGREALNRIISEAKKANYNVNVYEAPLNVVTACRAILHKKRVGQIMEASAVDLETLISSLKARLFSGVIELSTTGQPIDCGYILFYEGVMLGAYTVVENALVLSPHTVYLISGRPDGRIQVFVAPHDEGKVGLPRPLPLEDRTLCLDALGRIAIALHRQLGPEIFQVEHTITLNEYADQYPFLRRLTLDISALPSDDPAKFGDVPADLFLKGLRLFIARLIERTGRIVGREEAAAIPLNAVAPILTHLEKRGFLNDLGLATQS